MVNGLSISLAVDAHENLPIITTFLLFIAITLFLSVFSGLESDTPKEFYVGDGRHSPLVSGLAIAGSFVSAPLLLNSTGTVATFGFDGIMDATNVLLSFGLLIVLARPIRLRNAQTLGDIFSIRGSGTAPRVAAAVTTLAVAGPFLVVQLIAAGRLTADLLGFSGLGVQQVCTVVIGGLMVTCVVLSGIKGLTAVQILAAVVVLVAMAVAALAVVVKFHGDFGSLFAQADAGSAEPGRYFSSGTMNGTGVAARFDWVGERFILILGSACMPHVLVRIHGAKDPATARRSVKYATCLVALLSSAIVIVGMGASALVGADKISSGSGEGDGALMLLARNLGGGGTLFTGIACAVFLSVLAVVGGSTVAAAGAIAKDIYQNVRKDDDPNLRKGILAARASAFLFGTSGILIAVLWQNHSTVFLGAVSAAIAASVVAPALLYTFYWKGYNRTGLLWTLYGGTALTVVLYMMSPSFTGIAAALFPGVEFTRLQQISPALLSVPGTFFLGWASSMAGRHRNLSRPEAAPMQSAS
ncbi:sodium:solute symporter family transporter [Streptomyces phaeochromogenes]|uniref:sodium:solute symporter family transporter n=1 Tax=Streptomyces phaeochromogenes TaxID=1923 RepID=UPI0036A3CA3D